MSQRERDKEKPLVSRLTDRGDRVILNPTTKSERTEGNGPHPAESLPGDDEAAAKQGFTVSLCFPADEFSSNRAGRSCLPHIKFPPSPTAPIGLAETKLTLLLLLLFSLGGFRSWESEAKLQARDNTRDSMVSKSERERNQNVLVVAKLSSYSHTRQQRR